MHRAGNRLIVSSNPTPARLWRRPCGVAWDAVPEPMVEYIDPDFYMPNLIHILIPLTFNIKGQYFKFKMLILMVTL
jgi:hypothetical protein